MRDPKHILITGASSGVGAALALEYAAPGLCLSLHGRNDARLAEVAAKAKACGAEVALCVGDVSDAGHMLNWIIERDQAKELDLVVANAGVSAGTAPVEELDDQAKAIFSVNVLGVFNTVHPVLPLMKERKRGQIAIVSSLAGFRGLPGASAYAASKAAVRVYGEALRAEMAPENVEVNVVCPGFIKTPMTDVNRFKMPFLMTPEKAAQRIRDGLLRNRARIAFPWQMYGLVGVLANLPGSVMDVVAQKTPRK
jgi:short-subunit dehydrogenase